MLIFVSLDQSPSFLNGHISEISLPLKESSNVTCLTVAQTDTHTHTHTYQHPYTYTLTRGYENAVGRHVDHDDMRVVRVPVLRGAVHALLLLRNQEDAARH